MGIESVREGDTFGCFMPAYGETDYWNERYQGAETENFEWYCDFPQLEAKITAALPEKNIRCLVVGAGTARFSGQMYDEGYENITNIDISDVCIAQMQKLYREKSNMQWVMMDVRMMSFDSGSFDFIFDKGTMDSLICGSHSEASALKMNNAVHKVLAPGGTYMNVTHGEPADRMKHFTRPDFTWVTEHSTVGTYHIYMMKKPAD